MEYAVPHLETMAHHKIYWSSLFFEVTLSYLLSCIWKFNLEAIHDKLHGLYDWITRFDFFYLPKVSVRNYHVKRSFIETLASKILRLLVEVFVWSSSLSLIIEVCIQIELLLSWRAARDLRPAAFLVCIAGIGSIWLLMINSLAFISSSNARSAITVIMLPFLQFSWRKMLIIFIHLIKLYKNYNWLF